MSDDDYTDDSIDLLPVRQIIRPAGTGEGKTLTAATVPIQPPEPRRPGPKANDAALDDVLELLDGAKGQTKAELAERLGVSISSITYRLEKLKARGKCRPTNFGHGAAWVRTGPV